MTQPFLQTIEPCWTPQKLEEMAQFIESCLLTYRIKAIVVDYSEEATFTLFRIELDAGVRGSQITALIPELCRKLEVVNIQVFEFIAGTPYIGLLVTNTYRKPVSFSQCLNRWLEGGILSPYSIMFGESITGQPVGRDLVQMPHLMIAGVTGSGKSMLMHSIIMSLLYRSLPADVRFIMFDTSQLELVHYDDIPHLIFPVITDNLTAINILNWIVSEMERRLTLFSVFRARNLEAYNRRISLSEEIGRPIPDPFFRPEQNNSSANFLSRESPIVICIDDYVQLIGHYKEIGEMLILLSQQGHAVGIHLLIATRSPLSANIGNQLRINIPTRIALTVSTKADSHLILDQHGAETLYGSGDMLLKVSDSNEPIRIQGAYITDADIHQVTHFCKQLGPASYIEINKITDDVSNTGDQYDELDPLFDQVVTFVVEKQLVSISGVQRQFRIGYNRAAAIVEQLEYQGIVSEPGHSGNRKVLVPKIH